MDSLLPRSRRICRRKLKIFISIKANIGKVVSDSALRTFITERIILFPHSKGVFCIASKPFWTFLLAFISVNWLLQDRKSIFIFVSGSAVTRCFGFYPVAGGSLDVSCSYLITAYNAQRGTEIKKGSADWLMKELAYCGSWLRQGSKVTVAAFWHGRVVSYRF